MASDDVVDERTPLATTLRTGEATGATRRRRRAMGWTAPVMASALALTLCAAMGVLYLIKGSLSKRPTTSTLEPGTYVIRGSFEGQGWETENYCALATGRDEDAVEGGISCSRACGANATKEKPERFFVTKNPSDERYRRIHRGSGDDAYYCVTDADEKLSRGAPAWKNLVIACDKRVNATNVENELDDSADFIIANVTEGAAYEYAVMSREQGRYCHEKYNKVECAYPGFVSRHARFDFIEISNADVAKCVTA